MGDIKNDPTAPRQLTPIEASKVIPASLPRLEVAMRGRCSPDLKPANIMRDAQDRMVVMDFGVAHWLRPSK